MQLTVRTGAHEGWTTRLDNRSYTLGRNRDNDLILMDRWISRRHCLLNFVHDRWYVVDLDSTHGVTVNGQAIEDQHALNHRDVIAFGEVQLEVDMRDQAPELVQREVASALEYPAILSIESGNQAGMEVRLEHHSYTIGRTRNNDIVLSDSTISRRHCLLGLSVDKWFILDLNSLHGVMVNNDLIDDRRILRGDESLRIGDIEVALRFVFDPLNPGQSAPKTSPRPLVLSIEDGLHEGWEMPLVHPSYTLGRARGNDIILADPSISRTHALFVFTRGRWTVEDLGSTLGVEVNGEKIDAKHPLTGGEKLQIGDVAMQVQTAFTALEQEAEQPRPRRRRNRAGRRSLRIIQALPQDEYEDTIAVNHPREVGLPEPSAPAPESEPRPAPRDDREQFMDTVTMPFSQLGGDDDDAPPTAEDDLDRQQMMETISCQMKGRGQPVRPADGDDDQQEFERTQTLLPRPDLQLPPPDVAPRASSADRRREAERREDEQDTEA